MPRDPEASLPDQPRPADRTVSISALLLYLLLSLALFAPAWRDPTRLSIGSTGDPELFMWLLDWTPSAVLRGQNPLVTDYVNFPSGMNLMWNAGIPLPGALLAPVSLLAGPVAAYNLLMTLALGLSAWCAYFAIRRLVPDRTAAVLGGLVYGFSPYMLAHSLGHANFVIALLPPLTLLLLEELLVRRRWRPWWPGVALGMSAGAQLLTGEEILATTVLFAGLGVIALIVMAPGEVSGRFRHAGLGLTTAAAVAVGVGLYPLYIQFLGPERVLGTVRAPDFYVSDGLSFVIPTEIFQLAPDFAVQLSQRFTGNAAEWNSYVGFPMLALLAGIAVYWRRRLLVRWSAVMAAGTALLSLGPHLHIAGRVSRLPLPWILVQHLPVFEDILPARLMLYFFLCAAVMVAVFAAAHRHDPRRWVRAAGFGCLILALVPLFPRVPWPAPENPVPAFFTSPDVDRIPEGSVALVAPFSSGDLSTPHHAMLWQALCHDRFRMPEGYVRLPGPNNTVLNGPPESVTQATMIRIQQGEPAPPMNPALRGDLTRDLQAWQVRTVIIGPMDNQGQMVQLFRSLLEREPERRGGVLVWWEVDVHLPRFA